MSIPTESLPYHRFFTRPTQGETSSDDAKLAFGIDCDRVVYSSAFRRLNGVTQVVSADETALFHNRLTHSLKVAQVAIRIAHRLRDLTASDDGLLVVAERYGDGIDPRVVRAASLAHDLGHPPFGHIAERELQRILDPDLESAEEQRRAAAPAYRLLDSFEGNAQSFRIVTKLAFREPGSGDDAAAMNLTRSTLRAILKYPWLKGETLPRANPELTKKRKKKWGSYKSEEDIFMWARGAPDPRLVDLHGKEMVEYRTIEAQIMDWADDITYAVHDLEDFYRAGLIPLHLLRHSNDEVNMFFDHAWARIVPSLGHAIAKEDALRIFDRVRLTLFPDRSYTGNRANREQLHGLASELIEAASDNIELVGGGYLRPMLEQLVLVEVLKEMTWYYVIKRPALSSAQRGQARLIRELYFGLVDWVAAESEDLAEIAEGRSRFDQWRYPARLFDYLEVAFSPTEGIGSTDYQYPKQKISRAVVDYIVSLTEAQAIAMTARLKGTSKKSMIEQWLQT